MISFVLSGILLFILLVFIYSISVYNGLVQRKAHVDEGWGGIQVQLQRRYDLIPNLASIVKGYSTYEKSTLEEIVRLRNVAISAENVSDKSACEAGLSSTLKTLFAVAENYPDLKANQNFLALQKDLQLIEQDIQLARRYYNGTARNYNSTIATFPAVLIASYINFKPVAYFDLPSQQEHTAPKIDF